MQKKSGVKKTTWYAVPAIVLAASTVVIQSLLKDRHFYLTGVLIILYFMLPFFVSFEHKKPEPRELVTLALLCALCVAGRAAFVWAPNFKPTGGLIAVIAMVFGPVPGFMAGAVSVFVSNMIFGQGPWTPWQMFAFGTLGLLTGLLGRCGALQPLKPFRSALIAAVIYLLVTGPILDTCTLLLLPPEARLSSLLKVYLAGLPINGAQAAATFATVLLLAKPLGRAMERLRKKYGILDEAGRD